MIIVMACITNCEEIYMKYLFILLQVSSSFVIIMGCSNHDKQQTQSDEQQAVLEMSTKFARMLGLKWTIFYFHHTLIGNKNLHSEVFATK